MSKTDLSNPRALQNWLSTHQVESVECLLCDHAGTPRGKAIPSAKFVASMGTDKLRAPESLFAQTINGDFIENEEHSGVEQDMILTPDLSTACLLPWADEPTAAVICDPHQPNSRIADQSPRLILKRILEKYQERGWSPVVAPEFEFYLADLTHNADGTPVPPLGFAGQRAIASQDHMSVDAKNSFGAYFNALKACCRDQGINIESLIGEAGPSQYELNILHGDPVSVADQSFYFKRAVRELARQHDLVATFLARPYADSYGSSMHLHQSLVDDESGQNLFANPDGSHSDLFLNYIGGLQSFMPAVMIFLAPYVNSFGRFGTGYSVPANTNWGLENRTAGLRVPEGGPEARRVENRIGGSDVNPYLAIMVSLACGWLGIEQGLQPTAEERGLAGESAGAHPLPRHLVEALDALDHSEAIRGLLGDSFVDTYLDVKREEYRSFQDELSPWDIKFLIHAV